MSNQNQGVAVITGASAGIGKVYADRFAKRGYDLLLVARRKDRLDVLSKDLQEKYGVKVKTLVADLTNYEDFSKVGTTIASNERISQ
ncbi:MAG TPA: SDR family NAD(P)-dependent oxidoreductase [Acidobacteriaceae bacterium]